MLERFLVPLDATVNAAGIVPHVTELARRMGQPVVVLSVIPNAFEGDASPLRDDFASQKRRFFEFRKGLARRYLNKICAQFRNDGVWATSTVVTGDEAAGILSTAEAKGVGLIAMSTHGRTGAQRWFMGSVADKVIRTALTPVLLVRPTAESDEPAPLFTALLVPLDGSAMAEAALTYATFLAKNLGVPVTLIRSLDLSWAIASDGLGWFESVSVDLVRAAESDAHSYLEHTADRLRGEGIEVGTSLSQGASPAAEIIKLADVTPGALVVMTTHGRSGVSRALLGSVTDKVVRSSAAPVLVIPPGAEGPM
ncbi:MAG: hypothetical protein FJ035_00035 [Chloroflexi bacterium]|nr:hypothetical protein [Chloroflexota bacterium]